MCAVARRLSFEQIGVAIETRSFGEQAPDIITGPVTEEQRHSILDDGQMAPVAGHEQIGRRSKRRSDSSNGERNDAVQPQSRAPQAEPDKADHHQAERPSRHRR
jgi:hypothetical protein